MIPVPLPAIGIAVLVWILSLGGVGWGMYGHGKFVQRAEYTEQQLQTANANLKASRQNQAKADEAGAQHEQKVQVVHDTTREIVRTITVPADADPYVPVWFARLLDRLASRSLTGDPFAGKSESDPSDVRLSEVKPLLAGWTDKYYACRQQVADIVELKPVLPSPEPPKKDFFDRLNPF